MAFIPSHRVDLNARPKFAQARENESSALERMAAAILSGGLQFVFIF